MRADDIYHAVTDRIVRALERGVVPWREPWTAAGRPRSMSTGQAYRGMNMWLLTLAAREHGWSSPWFGTYRQIRELGGQVRAGERSTLVTFWKAVHSEERDQVTGEERTVAFPVLRRFLVFNAGQADGLPGRYFPEPGQEQPIGRPQVLLDGYLGVSGAPLLRHDVQGQAYYDPVRDVIRMPPLSGHRSPDHYYATAFHEAAHSTGHPSRLDRSGITSADAVFGSHEYGKEELVAQMAASMLCAETGVDTEEVFENSASYIGSWITTLKGEPRMVLSAATAAQRASDLIAEPTREALRQVEAGHDPEPERDLEAG